MKGSIIKRVIFILTIALMFAPFNLWADEEKPTYEELEQRVKELEETNTGESPSAAADIGIFSKYVWRGFELSEDSLVIQPSATVEYKGFSVNLWGNLDTDNKVTEESEFNETDLTVAYDTSVGDFDIGVGYIYYALDGASDPEEIYGSVCAAAIPLAPTLTVYRDITEFIGWYLNLGISHSLEFKNGMTLDMGGSVGYYYSDDDAFVEVEKVGGAWVNTTDKYRAFHDAQLSVSLTIPLDKYFSLTPMIAYSFPLSGDSDDLITSYNQGLGYSSDSDYFFGGVTLSMSF
jgi:hypothetical protein